MGIDATERTCVRVPQERCNCDCIQTLQQCTGGQAMSELVKREFSSGLAPHMLETAIGGIRCPWTAFGISEQRTRGVLLHKPLGYLKDSRRQIDNAWNAAPFR